MLKWLDVSRTRSVKHSKDQVSKTHTSPPAPGPAPFSLVWQIFPAIVTVAFLLRRPCLWRVPHSRVKRELLDSAALLLGGSARGAVLNNRLSAQSEQREFWQDSAEICHSRKSATENLCWYFTASHGCHCGSRTIKRSKANGPCPSWEPKRRQSQTISHSRGITRPRGRLEYQHGVWRTPSTCQLRAVTTAQAAHVAAKTSQSSLVCLAGVYPGAGCLTSYPSAHRCPDLECYPFNLCCGGETNPQISLHNTPGMSSTGSVRTGLNTSCTRTNAG